VIGRLGPAGRQQEMGPPIAPLRVGVVTPGGQGWTDFEARLQMTPWAWDLRVLVTPSEGPRAAESIARAVRDHSGHADLVVVTRGGGSGVTAAYDTGVVPAAICQADCPVIVAVGHHDDFPVAETVAWRREATPTAAAVTLDRVLAAQRDDLARALASAVDDAQRHLAAVTRRLEDTWSGFQTDLQRLTAPAAGPVVAIPPVMPAPPRPALLVVAVAALMTVLVVGVIVLAVTK
jgi:exonuclease VII large subunit